MSTEESDVHALLKQAAYSALDFLNNVVIGERSCPTEEMLASAQFLILTYLKYQRPEFGL